MSWLFSQALVAASSEDISWDGEQCALWNGTPTQLPSWCSDRTMAASPPQVSRSGMTFKPLTDDRGEAVLMSFLEAFPVLTSPLPEKAQESTESSQACGHTWQESLVKYDLNTSSWKTHHCLWEEDLPESSVTLPRWGMMQDGECWERITLPLLIGATESGSLPTPTANSYGTNQGGAQGRKGKIRPSLQTMARKNFWPTPTAAEADKISNQANYGHKGLSNHPAIVGKPTRPKRKKSRKGEKQWPTPSARDWKDSPGMSKEGVNPDGSVRKRDDQLARRVFTQEDTQTGGLLNPNWVEWLMGWPIGWTDLNALATDKSRSVQR